jgi:hypothetical protein
MTLSRVRALAAVGCLTFVASTVPTTAPGQTVVYPGAAYVYPQARAYAPYPGYAVPGRNPYSYYARPSPGARRYWGGYRARRRDWPTGRGVPLAKPWLNPY